jgi:hypothetical protein
LVLGGGVAFFLYYFQAVMPYLGGIIEHLFLTQKTTLYQAPATTLNAFLFSFGFVFVFGLLGVFVAFFNLRKQKRLTLFLILFLGLAVPFVLAESYLFGLYLPFGWFLYYLMPSLVVFSGAFLVFGFDKVSAFYSKYSRTWKKIRLRAVVVVLVVLMASMFLVRFGTVYGKITEASVFYSTSDLKGCDAGVWLSQNYPGEATVVDTMVPGFWFQVFSGKNVIAATDPIIERNLVSETVLALSYELEHPQTLLTAFEAKGDISDETSVSVNDVWNRVSYSSGAGDFISYTINGVDKYMALSNFTRTMGFEGGSPPQLVIRYANDEVTVAKTVTFQNDSYPMNIQWTITPLQAEVSNVVLYVSVFFDLRFSFTKAYLPGLLDWENPWAKPSSSHGTEWAIVDFSPTTLTDNCIGLYDEQNAVTLALKFDKVPEWGNVGALASMQIDAVRFHYTFDKITPSQQATFAYQVVTFSRSSNPTAQATPDVWGLFTAKVPVFDVKSRDYQDYIKENDVKFIVYDKNQLDTKMAQSKLLELIYSNDRYVIFKIRSNVSAVP